MQDRADSDDDFLPSDRANFLEYVAEVDGKMKFNYGISYREMVTVAPSSDYYGVFAHMAYRQQVSSHEFAEFIGKKFNLIKSKLGDHQSNISSRVAAAHNMAIICMGELANQPDCEWLKTPKNAVMRKGQDDHIVMISIAPPSEESSHNSEPKFGILTTRDPRFELSFKPGPYGRREISALPSSEFTLLKVETGLNEAIEIANAYIDNIGVGINLSQDNQDDGGLTMSM